MSSNFFGFASRVADDVTQVRIVGMEMGTVIMVGFLAVFGYLMLKLPKNNAPSNLTPAPGADAQNKLQDALLMSCRAGSVKACERHNDQFGVPHDPDEHYYN